MKSRKEVVKYIIEDGIDVGDLDKGTQFHLGLQEFRALLDFIYGGKPKADDEKLTKININRILNR